MSEIKNKSKIKKYCLECYEKGGVIAVESFVEAHNNDASNPYPIPYEHCKACDNDVPSIDHECLCCGQTTTPPKPKFYKAVLKPVKDVMKLVYPQGGTTLKERMGDADACCPDCGANKWMLLADESVAVVQGGKAYIECLTCGLQSHL